MFPLFETIKIDQGVPQHLEWHQRRMDYAFHVLFGSNNPMQLRKLIRVPEAYEDGVVKCRFLYNSTNSEVQFMKHTPRQVSTLRLVHCNTIDYTHKYLNRAMLTDLLEQKGEADDILIVRDGLLTDTSFSNIVFFDGTSWITPEEPLLEGTARNRLLAEGKLAPVKIRKEDLKNLRSFRLINAMLEFERAKEIRITHILE